MLPKGLQRVYKENFEHFDEWAQEHRDFQWETINSFSGQSLGSCFLPTGTGKTRVQIHLHMAQMIENSRNGKPGVYVIGAHRLLLCHQLLNEFVDLANACGIRFNILFIGSSVEDSSDYNDMFLRDYGNNVHTLYGTDIDKINAFLKSSQTDGRQTIVVSTYHSFNKMRDFGEIDICTYDEAHSTTERRFTRNINAVRGIIKRNYFFTATKRIINKIAGMADEAFYGKELSKFAPKEMIDRMEIVPPIYHLIKTTQDNNYSSQTMLVKTILEGFQKHKKVLKKISSSPKMIGAKMLVSTNGNDEMDEILSSSEFITYCQTNKIRVFSFSSEGGFSIDFASTSRSRKNIQEQMNALRDDEDAILLHIRILTEGINLPSITGVLILRALQTIELTQTIGRAMRLLKFDRQQFYSGKITARETEIFFSKASKTVDGKLSVVDGKFDSKINKLVKPCCFVIIPENFKPINDDLEGMRNMIYEIYNKYDIPIDYICQDDIFTTEQPEDAQRITLVDQNMKQEKMSELKHILQDFIEARSHGENLNFFDDIIKELVVERG